MNKNFRSEGTWCLKLHQSPWKVCSNIMTITFNQIFTIDCIKKYNFICILYVSCELMWEHSNKSDTIWKELPKGVIDVSEFKLKQAVEVTYSRDIFYMTILLLPKADGIVLIRLNKLVAGAFKVGWRKADECDNVLRPSETSPVIRDPNLRNLLWHRGEYWCNEMMV